MDLEVVRAIQARPKKKANNATEVRLLEKRAAELERDIKRGSANLLKADAEVFGAVQAQLLEWKQELLKVQNTLTLAAAPPEDDASVNAFLKWWSGLSRT